jgi:amino acid adenylation domain-containing protein
VPQRPALPDPTAPLRASFEGPVHALVARQARRTPDATALRDANGALTYHALARAAAALAATLARAGVRRGDVVAVAAQRTATLPIALLGVLEAGAAFAILDPSYPPERLGAYLSALAPRALVQVGDPAELPAPARDLFGRAGVPAIAVDALAREAASRAPQLAAALQVVEAGPDDLAYVAFTSGTTGRPKGILGAHRPLPHFLRWHVRTSGLDAADRFAMLSGLAHDPLLRDVFTPLVVGAPLLVPEGSMLREPDRLLAWLWEEGVTVVHATPSLARLLVDAARRRGATLPALRHLFLAGEPLDRALLAHVRALAPGARVVNFYGATETPQAMGWYETSARDADPARTDPVPVGRGIDDVQLLVVTEGGHLAAPGELGEIWIRTPYLAAGYLADAPLAAERFATNPFTRDPRDRVYRTGDLGRVDADGIVSCRGRADGQVKIRGFRVELGEIEATLAAHPGVEAAAAAVVDRGDGDGVLVAWVQARDAGAGARARERTRAQLPEYMIPRDVIALERFPLTPNGKLDRAALPRPAGDRRAGAAVAPPGTDTERRLAAIWEVVLAVRPIGRDESFFDLGGHSLLALELLARVERELGRRLPLNALLTAGTVREMAALLDRGDASARASLVVPLERGGDRPPVYWLPGGGGLSVMAFRQVSRLLGPDQRVFGLEAELDLARAPADLPGIAARYVAELRAVQPRGPYALLGFSLGSFVAWEMAVQLRAAGEELALLAVFDTEAPVEATRADRARVLLHRARYRVARLARADGNARIAWARGALSAATGMIREAARRRAAAWRAGPRGEGLGAADAFQAVIERNRNAVFEYARRPLPCFDGRVTVILAEDGSMSGVPPALDARLAWSRAATRGADVHAVPGNHLSMLEAPHVDRLAATLRGLLDRAFPAAAVSADDAAARARVASP